eukprot:gene31903-41393_t
MGGPCFIVNEDGEKRVGPPATDNFQIFPFSFRGSRWFSAEQCYQAMKFPEGSKQHTLIRNLQPQVGESEWDYGIKVWQCGQNLNEIVRNWGATKVEMMYLVNCAKYACNPVLQQQLLDTGDKRIVGMQSTWEWEKWNGLIQMLIRQKLKEGVDLQSIETVTSKEWNEVQLLSCNRTNKINILEKTPIKDCMNKLPIGGGKKYLIAVLHIIRESDFSSLVDRAYLPDDADAIWTDFGVDRSGITQSAVSLSKSLFSRRWKGLFFGGFFFKGFDQRLPEENTRLAQFVTLANQTMHVCTVSGPGTGQPIAVETLARIYTAVTAGSGRSGSGMPIALASGVDDKNIESFLPYGDYFMVGSGIEQDATDPVVMEFYRSAGLGRAVSIGHFDAHRITQLAEMIHSYNIVKSDT